MNSNELIKFEKNIASIFNQAKIKAPVHLHGGNEQQLIDIFKNIKKQDWVFSSWRSHYHCLLKGVPPQIVENDIINGKSITLLYPDFKIYTSAIVAGTIPIALGTALGIKKNNLDEKVYLFIGDMTSETGFAYEAHKYAINFDLPIIFVIENNKKSVCTETLKCWSQEKLNLIGKDKVIYYDYELPWPHAGAGVRVQF